MCLQHGLCRVCSECQHSKKSLQLANLECCLQYIRVSISVQLKGLPGFLKEFCSVLYCCGSLGWSGLGFIRVSHSIDAAYYRAVYISLLPALSSPSIFSVPSLPKKLSKPNDSGDAPGVDIVHGRSSYHLRICHVLLEDMVLPGDWVVFVCGVCTDTLLLCFSENTWATFKEMI